MFLDYVMEDVKLEHARRIAFLERELERRVEECGLLRICLEQRTGKDVHSSALDISLVPTYRLYWETCSGTAL